MQKIDFTIGDEVVCIKNHSTGLVKKGQTFKVFSMKLCKCGKILINIGINVNVTRSRCVCNHKHNDAFFCSSLFRKVDPLSKQLDEIEESSCEIEEDVLSLLNQ